MPTRRLGVCRGGLGRGHSRWPAVRGPPRTSSTPRTAASSSFWGATSWPSYSRRFTTISPPGSARADLGRDPDDDKAGGLARLGRYPIWERHGPSGGSWRPVVGLHVGGGEEPVGVHQPWLRFPAVRATYTADRGSQEPPDAPDPPPARSERAASAQRVVRAARRPCSGRPGSRWLRHAVRPYAGRVGAAAAADG
jgi:hypothetical protein